MYTVRDINLKVILETRNSIHAIRTLHKYVNTQKKAFIYLGKKKRLNINVAYHVNRFGDPMVVINTPIYNHFIAALIGVSKEEYIRYSPIEIEKRRLQQLVEKFNVDVD